MPFAAALSEHPVPAFATGEACGQLLEALGTHPDLVLAFVTLAHAGALEDGAASESIVATGREIEGAPAVSLWAGRFGPVVPVRIAARAEGGGVVFDGLIQSVPFTPQAMVLLGDPFSMP